MLMIATLFFLGLFFGLWFLITFLCMKVGGKLGQRLSFAWGKGFGSFMGFMLSMGGFIVYWIAEYWILQVRVTHLCETRGGTKIYLTPEEYRKKIGEEEWKNLHEIDEIIHVGDGIDSLLFQGRKYKPRGYDSNRIISFQINGRTQGIAESDIIYYDYKMRQVIFQRTAFGLRAPSILDSLEGLKFWLNNIKDCSDRDLPYEERFRIDQYTNIKRSK